MEGMIGEIRMFGGNFAPRSWGLCEGQLLSIAQNTALFSILGTTYGGDGRTTFGLPDLRGRVPMGNGNGPGLTPRRLGAKGGVESVVLTTTQIPQHSHSLACNSAQGDVAAAQNNFIAASPASGLPVVIQAPVFKTTANSTMNAASIGNTGNSQSHTNVQPFLVLNFIICLQGVFPSRS